MNKQTKQILQSAMLAIAIGVSIISYDLKNSFWFASLAGALIAVYVHISNTKTK